ncbi:MAG: response regulator [Planctomycetota bacterium]
MAQDYQLLYVEDDEVDYEQIRRVFKRLGISAPLHRARDGEEALQQMRAQLANPAVPLIVLLDLHLPGMNGIEFLHEVRKDEALCRTPVFVLSTSKHERDIAAAYEYNVCGYVAKPLGREELASVVQALQSFWSVCLLPSARSRGGFVD